MKKYLFLVAVAVSAIMVSCNCDVKSDAPKVDSVKTDTVKNDSVKVDTVKVDTTVVKK